MFVNALACGTRIDGFEIVEAIGSGGTVYRVFLDEGRVVLLGLGLAPDAPVDAGADVGLLGRLAYRMLAAPIRPAFAAVLRCALSPDPADRPASAGAFLEALRTAAGPVTPALAVHVQAWADAVDAALLADRDAVLAAAARDARVHGFVTALDGDDSVLLLRPLAGADPQAARRSAVEALRAIYRCLVRRPERHPALRVGMCLRLGTAGVDDGGVWSGELCDLAAWLPPAPIAGFVGAPDVFAGLALRTLAGDDPGLVRVPMLAEGSTVTARLDPAAAHVQTLAQMGRMLAGIVHELRSPLSVVQNNVSFTLEALESGRPLGADDVCGLRDALRDADRIVRLAGEILKASSVSGHVTQEPVRVDDIVDSALILAQGELKAKAEVRLDRGGPCWVHGSRPRLTQAVMNLLVNAAQAIQGFGTIEVRVGRAGDRVRLEVADSGVGMDDEVQRRIFEPFFTTKPAGAGTGLGLALVREAVEEHAGTLAVRSAPAQGTCITIELPAYEA